MSSPSKTSYLSMMLRLCEYLTGSRCKRNSTASRRCSVFGQPAPDGEYCLYSCRRRVYNRRYRGNHRVPVSTRTCVVCRGVCAHIRRRRNLLGKVSNDKAPTQEARVGERATGPSLINNHSVINCAFHRRLTDVSLQDLIAELAQVLEQDASPT
jgi:hypothetical protein